MFKNRPLIAWTILEAQRAAYIDKIVVTTEDQGIAEVASEYGAEVIYRPVLMATDKAIVYEAIKHAIGMYKPSYVCLLQPTSPLRTADDIDQCVMLALDQDQPVQSWCNEANGAVYVASSQWLLNGGNWDKPGVLRYEMPPERSVDINTLEDFERAERLAS